MGVQLDVMPINYMSSAHFSRTAEPLTLWLEFTAALD